MTASPLKVLIVDDEPPIRKLLRMGLGTQGYQIIDAANATAALDLLAEKPDLVILDLACLTCRASSCCAGSGRSGRICPSWCCRAAATR
jgi:DNA-binding response OmpR family regulator